MPTLTTLPTYRIIRHRDPRGTWYDVEGMTADGARWHVAVADDRHEAREIVRQVESADARRHAVAIETARRAAYARLDQARRHAAAVRHDRQLVETRAALARELRDARRAYDAAAAADDAFQILN